MLTWFLGNDARRAANDAGRGGFFEDEGSEGGSTAILLLLLPLLLLLLTGGAPKGDFASAPPLNTNPPVDDDRGEALLGLVDNPRDIAGGSNDPLLPDPTP